MGFLVVRASVVFTFSPERASQLLPVGGKSHKRVHYGSCFGRDFSIMVQPILKEFTVLETVIQGLHVILCDLLDIFAP